MRWSDLGQFLIPGHSIYHFHLSAELWTNEGPSFLSLTPICEPNLVYKMQMVTYIQEHSSSKLQVAIKLLLVVKGAFPSRMISCYKGT